MGSRNVANKDLISEAELACSDGHVHRRDVLKGMFAMGGVLALTPPTWAASQPVRNKPAGLIDVHHHILPPGASEASTSTF